MEKLCAILDTEEEYAVRMASILNQKKTLKYVVKAFTNIEAYTQCLMQSEIALLIVDEHLYNDTILATAEKIVVLSEKSGEVNGTKYVKKYQASDEVIREIINVSDVRGELFDNSIGTSRLVSIYSPFEDVRESALALTYAYERACNEKVLLVSLVEFAGLKEILPERNGNLSDALYYFFTDNGKEDERIIGVIDNKENFDYIAPTPCALDLPYMSTQTIIDFIERIVSKSDYDTVVLEVGNLIKEPWRILNRSDMIICLNPDSAHKRKRQTEFEEFMHYQGYEQILNKIKMFDCEYKEDEEAAIDIVKLSSSEYGMAVRALD